jgi:hypothetical protein
MEPEKYIYELPDDYTMKFVHRVKIDKLVKEQNLTNEEAQRWIDLHVELVEEFAGEMQGVMVRSVMFFTAVSISVIALTVGLLSLIF